MGIKCTEDTEYIVVLLITFIKLQVQHIWVNVTLWPSRTKSQHSMPCKQLKAPTHPHCTTVLFYIHMHYKDLRISVVDQN